MKNIIVPTDFSDTAKNAAIYAAQFAAQVGAAKIVLYNAYMQPIATDTSMTPVELIDFDELKKIANKGLENFKTFLNPYTAGIEVETFSEYTTLQTGLYDVCESYHADAIVMGVTGSGGVDEVLMGSNAVSVAKHSTLPVIVVPPGTSFSSIKNVVLACDFKRVVETTPVEPLKHLLDETKAKLFVLNIDHNNKNFNADTPFESLMLDTLLQGYNPSYHFIDNADFVAGINNFAVEKNIDLIVTIPKKHGFFESIFKRSHTKRLAFHSHIPLMVLHD